MSSPQRLAPFICGLIFSLSAFAQDDAATVENATNDPLLWLAVVTMILAVGAGVWQLRRVQKAKRNHEHSSLVSAKPATHGDRKP